MDFAVVRISGKQYLVTPNQKLEIEGNIAEGLQEYSQIEVLLSNIGGKLDVGTPTVSGLSLKAKVANIAKGDKIRVSKFKAKSRYRRTMGFRPIMTVLEFEDFGSQKPTVAAVKEKKVSKKAV